MNAGSRRFVDILIRSFVVQIAVAVALVSMAVIALGRAEIASPARAASHSEPWNPAYSQQFPGCVATALWPDGESPRAYLARSDAGDLHFVPVRLLTSGWVFEDLDPEATVIGVCR